MSRLVLRPQRVAARLGWLRLVAQLANVPADVAKAIEVAQAVNAKYDGKGGAVAPSRPHELVSFVRDLGIIDRHGALQDPGRVLAAVDNEGEARLNPFRFESPLGQIERCES